MLTFRSSKAVLVLRPVAGRLVGVIKSPSGTLLFQGFIESGVYSHLRGLFLRYFSVAKTEEIMTAIIIHFGE